MIPYCPQVETARPGDVMALHRLRRQLEDWLHARDVWQWPSGEVSQDKIASQVQRQQWRLVRHGELEVAAAMRVLWSDPDFWGEDADPAVYVHGLMVDRAMAGMGVGESLLDWVAELGRNRGVGRFRLDCAESNEVLRSYYRRQGFHELGRRELPDLFSVTLFEKAI